MSFSQQFLSVVFLFIHLLNIVMGSVLRFDIEIGDFIQITSNFLSWSWPFWQGLPKQWQQSCQGFFLLFLESLLCCLFVVTGPDEHLSFLSNIWKMYWPISNIVMSENPIQRPKIPPQLAMNQMMGTCNQKDKIETIYISNTYEIWHT